MTNTATVKFTYQDYKTLPKNGKRYQVVEGDLVISPSPKIKHPRVSINLTRMLDAATWSSPRDSTANRTP